MTDVLERDFRAAPTPPTDVEEGRGAAPPVRGQPRNFRPDIEGLRAIAIVAVVLYDADLGVRSGFVGIDIFFVICGFLITRQLLAGIGIAGVRALRGYYGRRIQRAVPAVAIVTIAVIIAARGWESAPRARSIADEGIFSSTFALNYRLAATGGGTRLDRLAPLEHLWPVSVAAQFLLGWPVLIVVAAWLTRARILARFRRPLLAIAIVAVVVVSFRWWIESTPALAYFSVQTRAWEFAAGALVAVSAGALARLPRAAAELAGLAGLAAVLASCFILTGPYPSASAAIPVGGTALVLAAGCGAPRRIERFLGESLMQCLGRISYPCYLWHWPLLVLVPVVVGHSLDWRARIVVVWVAVVVSVIAYFVTDHGARRRIWAPVRSLGLGAGLLAVAVCAGFIVRANPPAAIGSGPAASVVHPEASSPSALTAMHQAITEGVNTKAVPRNLSPALVRAASDTPASDGTPCLASLTIVDQGPCVYGDWDASRTVVLFGDATADMWLPAFDAAGQHERWRIVDWTSAACPASAIPTDQRCDTWRASAVRRIAELKPALVVVSSSESGANGPQWASGLVDTMNSVRTASGAQVVLLQDVPHPTGALPTCVENHLDDARACSFAATSASAARHRAAATAAAQAGYPVIDPTPWLCASTCPAIVGNLLTYRDDAHLSATFSAWLWPQVAPQLALGSGR